MQILNFTCKNQILAIVCPGKLVVAESRKHVYAQFALDDIWDGLAVTAVFTNVFDSTGYEKILTGDLVEVPTEVLRAPGFRVSLHGANSDGLRLTTAWMERPVQVHRAGDLIGLTPEDATPELWEQVLALMGDLSNLDTVDKSSLVSAINEVRRTGGGTGGGGNVYSEEISIIKAIDRADYEALPVPRPATTVYLIRG